MRSTLHIRRAKPEDEPALWRLIRPIIARGDTYAFAPHTSRTEMMAYWLGGDKHTYVATLNGALAGTYILKDNQPALGAHVANGSYMVSEDYRGAGIGWALGSHSLAEAEKLGYKAIQFNMVVSTNSGAVRLWKKLGFKIIGEVPEAFDHAQQGLVSVYIMHQLL